MIQICLQIRPPSEPDAADRRPTRAVLGRYIGQGRIRCHTDQERRSTHTSSTLYIVALSTK